MRDFFCTRSIPASCEAISSGSRESARVYFVCAEPCGCGKMNFLCLISLLLYRDGPFDCGFSARLETRILR